MVIMIIDNDNTIPHPSHSLVIQAEVKICQLFWDGQTKGIKYKYISKKLIAGYGLY